MSIRSLYRIVRAFPPRDEEYLTPRELGRKPKANSSDEDRRSLDALSSWDTEEGARRIAQQFPKLGRLIVRYDIPDTARITAEQTIVVDHFDLHGDMEELKRYLAPDFVAQV
jgi:hypothetical protein